MKTQITIALLTLSLLTAIVPPAQAFDISNSSSNASYDFSAQTEGLDQDMGRAWLAHAADAASDPTRYTAAWRTVGQRHARQEQLQRVLAMGTDLAAELLGRAGPGFFH